jgi:hypothetical protein
MGIGVRLSGDRSRRSTGIKIKKAQQRRNAKKDFALSAHLREINQADPLCRVTGRE